MKRGMKKIQGVFVLPGNFVFGQHGIFSCYEKNGKFLVLDFIDESGGLVGSFSSESEARKFCFGEGKDETF